MTDFRATAKQKANLERQAILIELLLSEVERLRGIIEKVLDGKLHLSPYERVLVEVEKESA